MPKLSIIVPVYNVEAFLAKCLDSLIYPDLKDYEIIAVNDGSTDSSADILTHYHQLFPNLIQIITSENYGLGAARNLGIRASTSEYLLFADSDDYLSVNAIPEILDKCNEKFDICFFDAVAIDGNGEKLEYITGAPNGKLEFSLENNPEIIFARANAWNKIYRRTLFSDNNIYYPSRVWYEDLYTTPKLYIHASVMQYEPKPWYYYLKREGSIINSGNADRNIEILSAVDSVLEYYKKCGKYEAFLPELEYMAYFNEYLTSNTRVNLIDMHSSVQDSLSEHFYRLFPNYRSNIYYCKMPKKYKLLDFLIRNRFHFILHTVMSINSVAKG